MGGLESGIVQGGIDCPPRVMAVVGVCLKCAQASGSGRPSPTCTFPVLRTGVEVEEGPAR